jgi:NCS1 family nucleobase:cation symporter-1
MLISLPIIYIRPFKLKYLFYGSSATIIVFEIVLLIWSLATMGPSGFGSTISNTGGSTPGWNIAFGIISTIGSIAAGILNQNDYARFARKPGDAVWGQLISFPFYAIVCCVVGILVTAATQERYGEAKWNLPTLFSAIIENGGPRSRAAAFFGGVALVVSQIGVNVPGNALDGGMYLLHYLGFRPFSPVSEYSVADLYNRL